MEVTKALLPPDTCTGACVFRGRRVLQRQGICNPAHGKGRRGRRRRTAGPVAEGIPATWRGARGDSSHVRVPPLGGTKALRRGRSLAERAQASGSPASCLPCRSVGSGPERPRFEVEPVTGRRRVGTPVLSRPAWFFQTNIHGRRTWSGRHILLVSIHAGMHGFFLFSLAFSRRCQV